jgi:hypothetical protein
MVVLGFVTACTSSGTSGASSAAPVTSSTQTSRPTGSAAYCAAFYQLRTSIQDLTKVNVQQDGVLVVQGALVRVQTSFEIFTAAAKATFGPQVDQLRVAINQLKTTLQASAGTLSAERVAAIQADIQAVSAAFNSLQSSVRPYCP